jgi:hypothetical protein
LGKVQRCTATTAAVGTDLKWLKGNSDVWPHPVSGVREQRLQSSSFVSEVWVSRREDPGHAGAVCGHVSTDDPGP